MLPVWFRDSLQNDKYKSVIWKKPFFPLECFIWDGAFGNVVVNAYRTGKAEIKFKFSFGNADKKETTIACGYFDFDELVLKHIVRKDGEDEAKRQSVTNDKLGNRATVLRLQNDPNAIVIVISNIKKDDPTHYGCRAFAVVSTEIDEVASNWKQLVILGKIN